MKAVRFLGDSLKQLRAFPESVRAVAGRQLMRVQYGSDPLDWKPMAGIGPGVKEIRIRDTSGAYRMLYMTSVGDIVVVLHAFKKTTQKTSKADIDLAASRLKILRQD